jgi:hypothetical protein
LKLFFVKTCVPAFLPPKIEIRLIVRSLLLGFNLKIKTKITENQQTKSQVESETGISLLLIVLEVVFGVRSRQNTMNSRVRNNYGGELTTLSFFPCLARINVQDNDNMSTVTGGQRDYTPQALKTQKK